MQNFTPEDYNPGTMTIIILKQFARLNRAQTAKSKLRCCWQINKA